MLAKDSDDASFDRQVMISNPFLNPDIFGGAIKKQNKSRDNSGVEFRNDVTDYFYRLWLSVKPQKVNRKVESKMFRKIIGRTLALSIRNASTGGQKERWDLSVGVLIERLPVITKSLNEIESEFMVSKSVRKLFNVLTFCF